MVAIPKPKRVRDPKYLAWIRTQPCVLCKTNPNWIVVDRLNRIEPNHIREYGHGGVGTKPSDRRAVPMHGWLHDHYHEIGRRKFEAHYQIDLEAEIERLNALYEGEKK